jgi:hypothetical protein
MLACVLGLEHGTNRLYVRTMLKLLQSTRDTLATTVFALNRSSNKLSKMPVLSSVHQRSVSCYS